MVVNTLNPERGLNSLVTDGFTRPYGVGRKINRKGCDMARPNCLTCGLCCCASSGQDRFCNVTKEDIKRLPRKYRLKVLHPSIFDIVANAFDGHTVDSALGTKSSETYTTCVALIGLVGHSVKCDVYDVRPEVCRTAIVPGDRNCRHLRKEYLK